MTGSLIDVPGLALGHASLGDTGVTVIRVKDERGAIASGEVRGGGPGTRETALLEPHNTVGRVHAITLAGGSAFGLSAADGVMAALAERHVGLSPLGLRHPARVPIVPAAVICDLAVGSAEHFPTSADGRAALEDSYDNHADARGSVGAGSAATAGRVRGGFGQAATTIAGYTVAAAVVANPAGEVLDPVTGYFYADPNPKPADPVRLASLHAPASTLNTTIGVVATNAPLTKSQAKRLVIMAHDGIAHAVRPAHSPLDGDTLFALSTAPDDAQAISVDSLTRLGTTGAEVVAAAIVDAVTSAEAGGDLEVTAYRELV